jgi:diguanylate cyclase (GGDEF)-like protein/PAS domain S-box-containing protein
MFSKTRLFGLTGVALAVWLAAAWWLADALLAARTQVIIRRETASVTLQADNITKNISRNLDYLNGIATLIAQKEDVISALLRLHTAPGTTALSAAQKKERWSAAPQLKSLDHRFMQIATALGANTIWLMDTQGDGIAASNADKPESFVGTNYADREYFKTAMTGKPGHQYAVGRKSNIPGLFFSAPVLHQGQVIGVAVAKIDLPTLAHWVNQVDAFVTDKYGVVILARDANLEMRALEGGTLAVLPRSERLAIYKRAEFSPLKVDPWVTQRFPGMLQFQHEALPLLMSSRSLDTLGIHVHVFQRLPEVAAYNTERKEYFVLFAAAGGGLLFALIGGLAYVSSRRQAAQDTARALSLLNAAIESTTDAILVIDTAGKVTTYNHQFVDLWRIPPELVGAGDGRPMLKFATTQLENPEYFNDKVRQLYAYPDQSSFETLQLKDGRCVERHSIPQRLEGKVVGRVWSFRDVTESKRAEQTLAERELELRTIIETEPECVKLLSADGTLLRMNRAGLDMIDARSEGQVIGKSVLGIILPNYREPFMALTRRIFDGENGTLEFEVRGLKGTHRWLETHAVPLRSVKGEITALLGVTRDITQRKAAEAEIRNLAFYDPLTALPNRRLLIDRLAQALAESSRSQRHGALMFLDLDHFKTLNDTQGHDVGDQLLIEVALRLRTCIREGDTVARLGGDEFVVMLENLSELETQAAAQAEAVAEKVRSAINLPYTLKPGEGRVDAGDASSYHCTSSIGISLFIDHEKLLDDLLKRADLAMYEAKAAGRDCIRFFDPEMQAVLDARARLEGELRHALTHHEFQLYYQVQVDREQRIVGAEALLRWIHPQRGLVGPAEFIPLAEETGLILPIGRWVLDTACAQLKTWTGHPAAHSLCVAVNISPLQFRQADFVAQVSAAVAQSGIDAARLKLELTESLLLNDVDDTIAKMQALNALGLRFALDDFGTGYSSLAYLKRLPLDQLKIDKSFVTDLENDDDDAAICAATIGLAHTLGIAVVAEGVETEAQRYFLASVHRCDFLQGYLFSRPLPLPEFEQLLNRA